MPAAPQPIKANLSAPAASLIPHRRPVCLIEQLLEVHAREGRAGTLIRDGGLYVNADDVLDRSAYLELMAQTFAALKGWRDRQHGHPPKPVTGVGQPGWNALAAPGLAMNAL